MYYGELENREWTRSTRQRKQPSKFYKFFLVFIDVFINNYDIVDCFGIKLRSNGLCHSSFRQASRGQNFRNSGRENPDF